MKLLLQAGIHLIKKVITFVIYGRSVQVFKACTLFYFFPAEFFFSQIFLREKGFVPQISQIYTDILHHDFSSSDFTDESEGILAYRITHGISQNFGRWPMARALYMLLLFFVTQISQMTQIFFIHRMTRNLFGDFLRRQLLTDFRGGDLSGRCRYPLELEYVPQRKICVYL